MIEGPAFTEAAYLSPFRTDELMPDITVNVMLTETITPEEKIRDCVGWVTVEDNHFLIDSKDHQIIAKTIYNAHDQIQVFFDKDHLECYGSTFLIRILRLPSLLLKRNEVFLHSSFIEKDGEAILFTAKCQTGKSTQAALWEKHRGAYIVNGDRALIRKENGVWLACGSPYCGTSKICHNRTLPIRAIVILSKAKENMVRRAGVSEAFSSMLEGCSFDTSCMSEVDTVTRIAVDLITSVPFYTLACTPDVQAVDELEKVL